MEIYVIDVQTRLVFPMSSSNSHVALSCVWDRKGIVATSRPIKLLDIIPRTFADAIKVITNSGQKNLWIDQYYISQDDPEE